MSQGAAKHFYGDILQLSRQVSGKMKCVVMFCGNVEASVEENIARQSSQVLVYLACAPAVF